MRTPTTDDFLHKEAVDLATDVASLMFAHRGIVRPSDAYQAAMECVRVSGCIRQARLEALPWKATSHFLRARRAAQRAIVAMDRAGAFAPIPGREVAPIERRLHDLALALGALGGGT